MVYRPRRCCRICGRDRLTGFHMSHSGLCPECGERRLAEQIRGNAGEPGPARDRWIGGIITWAAGLGGSILTSDEAAAFLSGECPGEPGIPVTEEEVHA